MDSLSSSRRRWTVGTVYNELSFASFTGFFRMSPLAQAAWTAAPYGAMAAADVMMPRKLQLLQLLELCLQVSGIQYRSPCFTA